MDKAGNREAAPLDAVGGSEPLCLEAADANGDDSLSITDISYSLTFLFAQGPPPPAPHPACGHASTAKRLTCNKPLACATH